MTRQQQGSKREQGIATAGPPAGRSGAGMVSKSRGAAGCSDNTENSEQEG